MEKYHTRTFRDKSGFKTLIKPSQEAQKRQCKKVKDIIRKHRGNAQAALIGELNPVIRGWTRYYRSCIAKDTFDRIDVWLLHSLRQWARHRHPHKSQT